MIGVMKLNEPSIGRPKLLVGDPGADAENRVGVAPQDVPSYTHGRGLAPLGRPAGQRP